MNRERARPLVLAVLAVVAIAVAAATLPTATESGTPGEGGFVGGGGEGGLIPTPDPPESSGVSLPASPLWLVLLLVVVAVALAALLRDRRILLRRLAGLVGLVAVIVVLFWLLSHADLLGGGFPGAGGPLFGEPAGGTGGSAPASPPMLVLVLVLVGVVLLGGLALALRGGGGLPLPGVADDEPSEPTEEAADVGRAAGRAADRIEADADVENQVYRAWREMTRLLDVANPDAATPGEFAAAGTAAGMDPDHVGELTRLFEDVRYGGDDPTEATERRALAVLRRIETAYDPAGDEGRAE